MQLTWYTGTVPPTPVGPSARRMSPPAGEHDIVLRPPRSPLHEEEVIASGWGGTDDDGDGMGMI